MQHYDNCQSHCKQHRAKFPRLAELEDAVTFTCYSRFPMPSPTPPQLPHSDRLALQRTRLANERTLFTYVRTSLALVGFGLALLQLHPERGWRLGYTALAVASVVLAVGLLRFRAHRRELAASELIGSVNEK